MSSERGDCSLASDLFIEDYIHIIPPLKPVRERGDTFLFSTPVPSIVGRRNGPARAAKAPAEMLSDQLQSKDIQSLFNRQNPKPARVPSTKGVSSSRMVSQYDT